MSSERGWLYGALLLLYVLHNDLWLWDDPDLVLGVPVGLAYHVGFIVAVAVVLFLLVRHAWPEHLEVQEGTAPEPGPGPAASSGGAPEGTVPRRRDDDEVEGTR